MKGPGDSLQVEKEPWGWKKMPGQPPSLTLSPPPRPLLSSLSPAFRVFKHVHLQGIWLFLCLSLCVARRQGVGWGGDLAMLPTALILAKVPHSTCSKGCLLSLPLTFSFFPSPLSFLLPPLFC